MAASRILIPFRLPQISCFTPSLKCFSSDSDNCPNAGIRSLLQFPHLLRAGPVLWPLLFSPLVPPSYRVLRGSIYSSPLVRSSCLLSVAVLHALLCLKVYPDVSVERDVLHVHLFHSHLVFTDTGFTKYFSCPFPFKLNILSFFFPPYHKVVISNSFRHHWFFRCTEQASMKTPWNFYHEWFGGMVHENSFSSAWQWSKWSIISRITLLFLQSFTKRNIKNINFNADFNQGQKAMSKIRAFFFMNLEWNMTYTE